MNSRPLSILSDDSAGESTATPQTAESATTPSGSLESYRARYEEFLNQQAQRGQRRRKQRPPVNLAGGLLNFAIFVALFLAILTLLGFGLSRLAGDAKAVKADLPAAGKQVSTAIAEPSPTRKNSGKR